MKFAAGPEAGAEVVTDAGVLLLVLMASNLKLAAPKPGVDAAGPLLGWAAADVP